ncbi:hypothetical protein BDZ91DRAFT_721897 [Kalaharituber pfeilii]|nr:hypothetical protein BDZ91DRAFT_721897 [Kalaharituber pfeilii]
MQYFKVTLLCSGIVYRPVSPDIAGMIMKVKEMVPVSDVLTRHEQHELRKPSKGYYVETRAT